MCKAVGATAASTAVAWLAREAVVVSVVAVWVAILLLVMVP